MDWVKHGKDRDDKSSVYKERRLSVPVTPELHKVIEVFRSHYPDKDFSEVGIIKTFIEGGVKLWMAQLQAIANKVEEPVSSDTSNDELFYEDYGTSDDFNDDGDLID